MRRCMAARGDARQAQAVSQRDACMHASKEHVSQVAAESARNRSVHCCQNIAVFFTRGR